MLVAAPTGAGKTIVGEFAVHLAMREPGDKAFYTTPIKALSNQKFRELQDVYGVDEVGLLTGDTNINGNARIVVMTTEVLRNMLYADSPALRGLRYVVMDEVHYLADRFRGAVWEEIIIHLPQTVRLVSLSATVSNAEEFGDWLDTVRGDTEVIVSEIRPVPLEQHVLVRGDLLPLFDDRAGIATAQVNQELMRIRSFKGANYDNNRRAQAMSSARNGGYQATRHRPNKGGKRPVRSANVQRIERLDRPDVVELLAQGEPAAGDLLHLQPRGLRRRRAAGPPRGRAADVATRSALEIRAIVEERTRTLLDEDLAVLGYYEWLDNLERGIAVASRGTPAGVQGGRRGALPAQAREGRLRHRDARPRHQHARAHRRAREAREVQRRGARRDHLGGVHAAHRPRRAPRHRRRGSRRHPVDRGARPAAGRRTRVAAHVSAQLELPPDVQHGGQPDRPVRAGARAPDPRVVVRAVPGRPRRRRPRTPGARAGGVARRVREGDDVRSRRLHRVLRDPA